MKCKLLLSITLLCLSQGILKSQCELEHISVQVKDTLVLKTKVKHVDLHAFVKSESKFLSSETVTTQLTDSGIDFEELYDSEYSAFGNTKKFRIGWPSNKVLEEVDELQSSRGNMLVRYELQKIESEDEITHRELSKVKSASRLKAQSIADSYNCKIDRTISIEQVDSITKYENVNENKLDVLIGWSSSINFNKNDKLIRVFEYKIKYDLK